MKSISTAKRVIWAVDAFTEDRRLHQKAISVLKAWSKQSELVIEPVFVMSPDQIFAPPEVFAHISEGFQGEARMRLKGLMKKAGLAGLLEPTFLESNTFSLRMAVQTLLDYARQTKAEFILASTQSKKGVTRFLFGSFAESLVLQSEIPVFLVSPKTVPSALKHVLFASDFSDKSKEAFKEIAREAKERNFKITVYNKVEYLTDYSMAYITASSVYQKIVDQDLLKRKAQANDLVEWAKGQGVEAEVFVDDKSKEVNVAAAILKATSKVKADTIAIASQSGRVASAILGSVTRQVVRSAKHPVWVVHPQNIEQAIPGKKSSMPLSSPDKKGAVAV